MKNLETAVLVMLWAVTIWRAPSALRTVKQRALWVAFAALTLSMTLRLPEVMHDLDDRAGITNLSTLIKHLLGVVAAGAVLDFVVAIVSPERDRRVRARHYVAITAMVLLPILFLLIPRQHEATDFFEAHAGDGWATAYYTVFVVYLGVAMGSASRLFWSSARLASAGWLRVGVRLMGIGTAVGVLYTLVRIAYLVCRLVGVASAASGDVDITTDLLKYIAIGFILVGSSIPAFGVAWRTVQDWRHLRELQPLWQDLTAAAPDIVLKARLLRGPRLQLHRRVIEIRDAGLALEPYVTGEVREAARIAARKAGQDSETGPPAEAFILRAAREAKAGGAAVTFGEAAESSADDLDDFDFDAEVSRLLQVARYYHSPVADAFLKAPTGGHVVTTVTTRPTESRAARLITDALEPKTWIIADTILIGWATDRLAGIGWGLLGCLFAAVIPVAFIKYGIRRGRWADRHLGQRQQRILVMIFIIASVATGIALMWAFNAPQPMIALIAAMLATLAALLAVTPAWKISVHAAVSSGSVAMLAFAYGPVALAGYALVAVVGWSRVALKDHTVAQVIAGTLVGTVVAAGTFAILR